MYRFFFTDIQAMNSFQKLLNGHSQQRLTGFGEQCKIFEEHFHKLLTKFEIFIQYNQYLLRFSAF